MKMITPDKFKPGMMVGYPVEVLSGSGFSVITYNMLLISSGPWADWRGMKQWAVRAFCEGAPVWAVEAAVFEDKPYELLCESDG